jgi:hypothetical protein
MSKILPDGGVPPIQTNPNTTGFLNPTPRIPQADRQNFLNSVANFAQKIGNDALGNYLQRQQQREQEQKESDIARAQFDFLKNRDVSIDTRQETLAYQQQYAYLTGSEQARNIFEGLNHTFNLNPDKFTEQYSNMQDAIRQHIDAIYDDVNADQYQRAGFVNVMNNSAANLLKQEASHLTQKQQQEAQRLVENNVFYYLRDRQVGTAVNNTNNFRVNLPTTQFDNLFEKYGNQYGISPALLKAVAKAESNFNPNAVSPKGATGLMQFMPGTARQYGITDRANPEQSVEGAAQYLAHLSRVFNGNIELMLAGYNAGEGAVKRHGNTVPPFSETQNYVKKITGMLQEGGRTERITPQNQADWQDFMETQAFIHPNGNTGVMDAMATSLIKFAAETGNGSLITKENFKKLGLEQQYALQNDRILAVQMNIHREHLKRQEEVLKRRREAKSYEAETALLKLSQQPNLTQVDWEEMIDSLVPNVLTHEEGIDWKKRFQSAENVDLNYELRTELQQILTLQPDNYDYSQFLGQVDEAVADRIITAPQGLGFKKQFYDMIKKQYNESLERMQQEHLDTAIIHALDQGDLNSYSLFSHSLSVQDKRLYIDKALALFASKELGIEQSLNAGMILSNDQLLSRVVEYSALSGTGSSILTSYFNGAIGYLNNLESFKTYDEITKAFRMMSDKNITAAKNNVNSDNYELLRVNGEYMLDYTMPASQRWQLLTTFNERMSSEEIRNLSANINPEKLQGQAKEVFDKAIEHLTNMDSIWLLGWAGGNNVSYWDRYNFTIPDSDGRRALARWVVPNLAAKNLIYGDAAVAERFVLEQLPEVFGLYFNDNKDLVSRDEPSLIPKDVAEMSSTIDSLREVVAAQIRNNPELMPNLTTNQARNIKSTDLRVKWDWHNNQLSLIKIRPRFWFDDIIEDVPFLNVDIRELHRSLGASDAVNMSDAVQREFARYNQNIQMLNDLQERTDRIEQRIQETKAIE